MPLNLASGANGATATGDGVNLGALIDDTEVTNWASLDSPIAGKQVTVRLDPSRARTFDRIQVSAMLRHRDPGRPGATAARRAGSRRCGSSSCWRATRAARSTARRTSQFTSVFTSAADAFPSAIPRPRAPELIIRSFAVPQTRATHVRLRVLTNQCTGRPPTRATRTTTRGNVTDCDDGSTQDDNVRAAELQVFR